MKRIVLAVLALAATSAAVSAQGYPWRYDRWDRYRDRGPVVIEQPGIQPSTIAAILALQLLNQPKEKEVVVERQVETERVRPLK